MWSVEVYYVTASCFDWLANNKAAALHTIRDLVLSAVASLSIKCDKVVKLKLLIFGVLDDEGGRDRAVVHESDCALSLCVHLGQFKINNRLEELDDWSSEICLH